MAKYRRAWNCACCGEPVIIDDEAGTITCGCGVVKLGPLPMPRQALKHYKVVQATKGA